MEIWENYKCTARRNIFIWYPQTPSSNKFYNYYFSYDSPTQKDIKTLLAGNIYTARITPTFGELKVDVEGNKIIFTPSISDPDGALDYYRIFINNRREPYFDEPIEVKMDLTGLEEIKFDVLISYDLNNGLGKIETTQSYIYNIITKELKEDIKEEPINPDDEKSGCKKDLSMLAVSVISLGSLLILIKKREK